MEELAFAGAEVPGVESHDEFPRRLESRLGGRVQRQVCLQDASEDEIGVGRRRVGESHGLAAQGDQILNGALEQRNGIPVGCEHRATPPVDECVAQRCLLWFTTIIPQSVVPHRRAGQVWRTTPVPAG